MKNDNKNVSVADRIADAFQKPLTTSLDKMMDAMNPFSKTNLPKYNLDGLEHIPTQYNPKTGELIFQGETIQISTNKNSGMICRILFKNKSSAKKKWSWDELIEKEGERKVNFSKRKMYDAGRRINELVAQKTAYKDFLILRPIGNIQINPKVTL